MSSPKVLLLCLQALLPVVSSVPVRQLVARVGRHQAVPLLVRVGLLRGVLLIDGMTEEDPVPVAALVVVGRGRLAGVSAGVLHPQAGRVIATTQGQVVLTVDPLDQQTAEIGIVGPMGLPKIGQPRVHGVTEATVIQVPPETVIQGQPVRPRARVAVHLRGQVRMSDRRAMVNGRSGHLLVLLVIGRKALPEVGPMKMLIVRNV